MRSQGKRAASTAATRRALIDAARELLAEGPWSGFTLEAVAGRAGVTRVTVYNQVASKAGLLDAVLTELTERAGMDRLLSSTQEMTPQQALNFVIEHTCRFWHTERAVLRPLFAHAAIDADIAANLARREQWRTDQFDALLGRMLTADHHQAVLPRDAVLAGMRAVTSFPAYDALGGLADEPDMAARLIIHLLSSLIG
ncbi:TetR/AcrR family transcriptional regulator [Actinospica robiniae]|uniref:TetR/AcrR family transcriptional regulator n=1 Tax=Actinospica robiniae TaxID=304901 RepID=UPI00040D20EB|nr:TetR/AcrR family transcriptional regulator [Actinospica robiniae]